jgi:hypothetical protein
MARDRQFSRGKGHELLCIITWALAHICFLPRGPLDRCATSGLQNKKARGGESRAVLMEENTPNWGRVIYRIMARRL